MTSEEKINWSEGTLWRTRVKGPSLAYAQEAIREDPYSLIPADATLSKQYHDARVRVSQSCLGNPDIFAAQNAASVALSLPDPVTADELAIKGAIINLWETLAGGKPVPPPVQP